MVPERSTPKPPIRFAYTEWTYSPPYRVRFCPKVGAVGAKDRQGWGLW